MAADANLIKGAATAYGAGTAAKQAGGNQLGAMAQNLLGKVDNRTADLKKRTEEKKERNRVKKEKFDQNSEAALQQGGALGEAEYDFTKRKVDALQKEYQQCTLGDDACRQKVMMALSKESQGLTSMKDTRKLNAESMLNLRGDVSAEQQEVMGIYANSQSGKYSMVEGTDGELRYTFDLGEGKEAAYTKAELDKMFEAQKDTVGTNETKKRAVANIELGKTGEPFSPTQEEAAFDTLTKTDNSLRSFLNDNWGVGTFAGSIEKKIQSEVGQLGAGSGRATFAYDMQRRGVMIPAAEGETNWYDNITDEDVQAIKAKLMNPETEEEIAISRQVAKEYYVDAQKQQYDKGVEENNKANLNEQNKTIEKYKFKQFETQLKMAIDNNASANDIKELVAKFQLEAGKETIETSEQVIPVGDNQVVENVNYKEGKDDPNTASMTVSTDRLKGIQKELDDPNTRSIVGYQGYYYKDGENNYRKFKNKQDFIKKQKIKVKDGESEDQAIARFNAKKNKGLVGGKATSYETIYSDEQLSGAQDTKVQKTSTSKTTNSAIGTDAKGNPILVEPKVKTADDII